MSKYRKPTEKDCDLSREEINQVLEELETMENPLSPKDCRQVEKDLGAPPDKPIFFHS